MNRVNFLKNAVAVLVVTALASPVFAQSAKSDEQSVEESYLQEALEMMIIREQIRSESREMKYIGLDNISNAIERGNKGEEVRAALEYLSLEGTQNKARENNRVVNNYPEVRTKAAQYLGNLGTPEARGSLLKIALAENEPMVLTEAIKSLGKIKGKDEKEETVTIETINKTFSRFDVLNPDNLLALSVLDAYQKIAQRNGGNLGKPALQIIMKISEGPYLKPVQDKAKALMNDLRKPDKGQAKKS